MGQTAPDSKDDPVQLAQRALDAGAAPTASARCREFQLSPPLAPRARAELSLLAISTRVLAPYPSEVAQGEPTRVAYEDVGLLISPYKVELQSASVRGAGGRV